MEEQRTHPGKEQSGLDVQGKSVGAADDNGNQNGGAKHGEHVLDAQQQHLGHAQLPRVADGFGVFFHRFSPFSSGGSGRETALFLRKKRDDQSLDRQQK